MELPSLLGRHQEPERVPPQDFGFTPTPRRLVRHYFPMDLATFYMALDDASGEFDSSKLSAQWLRAEPLYFHAPSRTQEEANFVMLGAAEQALFMRDNPRNIPEFRFEGFEPIVFTGFLPEEICRRLDRARTWEESRLKLIVERVFRILGVQERQVDYRDISTVYLPNRTGI